MEESLDRARADRAWAIALSIAFLILTIVTTIMERSGLAFLSGAFLAFELWLIRRATRLIRLYQTAMILEIKYYVDGIFMRDVQ